MTDFISFSGLNLLDSSDILNELLKTRTKQETGDKEKYQTKIGWVHIRGERIIRYSNIIRIVEAEY